MRNLPAARRGLAGWTGLLLAAAILVSIGTPLLGLTSFHASDVLQVAAPWAHDAPHDFRPQNGHVTDTVDAVAPSRLEFRERVVGDREFPLWNPWWAGGSPLGSLPNASTLLPFTWLWLVLPGWAAPGAIKLVEMVTAAGFTALLGRRLGLGWAAALLGGMVYVNSGFQVAWTNWPQAQLGALVPALFWAVERALPGGAVSEAPGGERPAPASPAAVWPIALVSAAMWLGGFPAVAFWSHLAVGVYILVRLGALALRRRRGPAAEGAAVTGSAPAGAVRSDPAGASTSAPVGRLLAVTGALVLGLGIAAIQVLPFALRLPAMDLVYRDEKLVGALPWETAVTLAVPNAFGTPADGGYYGPVHYVEVQSFVGIGALLLVAVALVAWRRTVPLPEVRAYLWAAVAVTVVLIFVGGPLLDLHDAIPVVGGNQIGRMRVLLGLFLALLAGIGFQGLLDGVVRRPVVLAALWSGLVAAAAALLVPAFAAAAEAGQTDLLTDRVSFAVFITILAIALLIAAVVVARGAPLVVPIVLAVVPVIVAVESVAFAHPFWPRIEPEHFYPETEAHEALRERVGSDRVALGDFALYPGTNAAYDIRSVTAHTLTSRAYADLLLAADPTAFDESRTFPFLTPDADVVTSPVLDRMGATLFVAPPEVDVIGPVTDVTEPDEVNEFAARDTFETAIPAGALRALRLQVEEPRATGAAAWLAVIVRGPDGSEIARGTRRVDTRNASSGTFDIPVVAGDGGWPDEDAGTWGAEIRVETADDGVVRLATTAGGEPALSVVRTDEDGLDLVWSDGAVVYERLDALPRIRWATTAEVIGSAEERVERLAAGDAPPEAVLLHDGRDDPGDLGEAGDSEPGSPPEGVLDVVEDSGDRISVRVDAEEGGWLVVADSLEDDWVAAVDGDDAPIVAADHAFGAVAVPAGAEEVALRYAPSGWTAGRIVSALSVVALGVLAIAARWRHPG